MSKQYRVTWQIDVDKEYSDLNTPVDAVDECWNRIRTDIYDMIGGNGNSWVWQIEDMETGEKWELDYEEHPIKQTKL